MEGVPICMDDIKLPWPSVCEVRNTPHPEGGTSMRRRTVRHLFGALLACALAACSGDTGTGSTPPAFRRDAGRLDGAHEREGDRGDDVRRRRPLREEAAIEPTSPPHILVQAATAKPLFAAQDSFWAKSGKGGELRLFYQGNT